MKRLMVIAAGTVALMSGAAYAGEGGCAYGKRMASDTASTPVVAAVDELDADKLKKLAATEEQAFLDDLRKKPVIHN